MTFLVVLHNCARLLDGGDLSVLGEDFPPHVQLLENSPAGGGEQTYVHSGPLVNFLQLLSSDMNFK